jgi:multidrug efflux pump subunit AcrA (membrane-fusion protein)
VKAAAFPDQIVAGKVTAIAPSAQTQSGVVLFPVTIGLEPITLPLRSGMTANTSIILTRTEGALIVPRRAIRTFNGGSFVEVQTDLGPNRAAVTLGATNDSEAQVLTGVNEGDVVIVTAVARARP